MDPDHEYTSEGKGARVSPRKPVGIPDFEPSSHGVRPQLSCEVSARKANTGFLRRTIPLSVNPMVLLTMRISTRGSFRLTFTRLNSCCAAEESLAIIPLI